MLQFNECDLRFGSNLLVSKASLQLYKGQRVGLVGHNGAGKTSLFRLILGELSADKGSCLLPADTLIGYVSQQINEVNMLLREYVLAIHPLIVNDSSDLPEYYSLPAKVDKLLINLGFKQHELYLPLSSFSGGWQMRANLARALFAPSDLLLLDEPTNHLDVETVIWFEDWLLRYAGLAIIISHDREFLDNVTTDTLSLKDKQLKLYGGNYSTFEQTRLMQIELQKSTIAKNMAKIDHLQKFVDRFRAKASKAKQAQSRMRMIEKLKVTESIPRDLDYNIEFLAPEYQVNKILATTNASFGYGDKILLSKVKMSVFNGSRIGLLGRNGIGKSTLIRGLINQSTLLAGEVELDSKIKIGYFAQSSLEQLEGNDTPLNFFIRNHKGQQEQYLRNYLGRYGFKDNKVKEVIRNLSGGEQARLLIANIILTKPNILFLDEPTNHLDMQMREELACSLQDFVGAVIIVSHDKFLLQSVVDEFYLIKDGKLQLFDGDLNDYHQQIC